MSSLTWRGSSMPLPPVSTKRRCAGVKVFISVALPWKQLAPMLQGGAAIQLRSFALNAAFVTATRRAQAMDVTGVSAAAYAISLQFWQLGGVALFALQSSASILVPAARAREAKDGGGPEAARKVA